MRRIILLEDQKMIRNGLRLLLESNGRYQVIAEGENGQQGLSILDRGTQADIIVSDIGMPVMNGLTMLIELAKRENVPPVLMVSMSEREEDFSSALLNGAAGFLSKATDANELFFALDKLLSGGRHFCSNMALKILEKALAWSRSREWPSTLLTRREIEILGFLAHGLTTAEIAASLFLSKRTVEGHRLNLIEKTGAKNTAALIRFACIEGIIT